MNIFMCNTVSNVVSALSIANTMKLDSCIIFSHQIFLREEYFRREYQMIPLPCYIIDNEMNNKILKKKKKTLNKVLFYKGFIDAIYLIVKELSYKELLPDLKDQSNKIKSILIEKYWSEKRKGFFIEKEKDDSAFNILVNVYALLFGSVPHGHEKAVADNIKKNITLNYPTPLIYGMVYLALAPYDKKEFIHKELKNKWAKMPSIKETGTFSELWFSELDWAVRCQNVACPNFILPCVILGVRPIEAGFKKFEVKPSPGFLKWAKGIVPTSLGDINIKWENDGDNINLEVKAPAGFKLEEEEKLNLTLRRIYKYY